MNCSLFETAHQATHEFVFIYTLYGLCLFICLTYLKYKNIHTNVIDCFLIGVMVASMIIVSIYMYYGSCPNLRNEYILVLCSMITGCVCSYLYSFTIRLYRVKGFSWKYFT